MRRTLICIMLFVFFAVPASAVEITAPEAPDSVQEYITEHSDSFATDLLYILKSSLPSVLPSVTQACRTGFSLIAITLLISISEHFSSNAKMVTNLVAAISMGCILLRPVNALVGLGTSTITEITEYGRLLLPVMASALAAQGYVTASSALYAGTAFFSAILSSAISKIGIPLIYVYLCLSIVKCTLADKTIYSLCDFIKWLCTWMLKLILYIFTGYMGITGVVSGTTDASALKATKLAISGMVPVVGGIFSDASESILLSTSIMKNAAGIYGILTVFAIFIGPFLKIGTQYIVLKITSAVCDTLGNKETTQMVSAFSSSMGYVLAMTGTVCLLQLISTVCFMKGAS